MKFTSMLILIPLALSLGILSCVGPGYAGGNGYSGGYNSYSTLPNNYNGNAYYHSGRYYSGGNYQTGNYSHQGKSYSNRYSHNGQYYYGGSHQNYTPQHNSGYRANTNINAPILQQHSNIQILPRHR